MISEAQTLIYEVDAALSSASNSRHSEMLRGMTDLFLGGSGNFSDDQIAVFDDVIALLIKNAELPALVELSARLAPLDNAPVKVIACLSCHDDMAVAGPVLEKSNALSDQTLIEITATKRPNHLIAIAGRAQISETVTDALLDRGNSDVVHKVIANYGARISEVGFVKLIGHAKTDKALAAVIAKRTDLPPELEPFLRLTLS